MLPLPSLHLVVMMVQAHTNRRFANYFAESLYETAVRMGVTRRGHPLHLDAQVGAELFGIQQPTLSDRKEVRDILVWLRDHPPLGWSVEPDPEADTRNGRWETASIILTPRHAPIPPHPAERLGGAP